MAEEPSRPKLRLTGRPPAPPPAPAAPPPAPERVFRAPALPVPESPKVRLPPPPPPTAAAPGRPVRPVAPPAAAPPPVAPAPAERASVLPLVGALACVVGAALFYTQVLRPRREAREAAAAAATPASPAPAAAPSASAPGSEANVPAVLERADPSASPEFRTRVLGLRLSGVFAGEPARAMIDGRLVRAGEVIDERLGVRFDGLEPGRRLRFRDASGAAVVRKY